MVLSARNTAQTLPQLNLPLASNLAHVALWWCCLSCGANAGSRNRKSTIHEIITLGFLKLQAHVCVEVTI